MSESSYEYIGNELELFSQAIHWKAYVRRMLRPHISGSVLEVGAGIGTTTASLSQCPHTEWTCLEPDPTMAEQCRERVQKLDTGGPFQVETGTLASLDPSLRYDTLLYIDVIEHIEDDSAEVKAACARLKPGGRLVVLVPAHHFLYTPFDKAIGHYRRYNLPMLHALSPPQGSRILTSFYLDSVGFMASLANRLLLKSSMPTKSQILLWDRAMVRLSTLCDPLIFRRFGKTCVCVWQAPSDSGSGS